MSQQFLMIICSFVEGVKEYQDAFGTTAATTYPHPLDLNDDGMITNDDAKLYD